MQISFSSNKLEKSVADLKSISKNYGERGKKVNQRIIQLKTSQTLEEMRGIPQANCHMLKGDMIGILAVSISGNHRITFVPDHIPKPLKDDGSLDWSGVTKIKILKIGIDYH